MSRAAASTLAITEPQAQVATEVTTATTRSPKATSTQSRTRSSTVGPLSQGHEPVPSPGGRHGPRGVRQLPASAREP